MGEVCLESLPSAPCNVYLNVLTFDCELQRGVLEIPASEHGVKRRFKDLPDASEG